MRCVIFAVCLLLSLNVVSAAFLGIYYGAGCPNSVATTLNSTYVNNPCTSLQPGGQILWWTVACQINGTNNNVTAYNSSTCSTTTTPTSLAQSFPAVTDKLCYNFNQSYMGATEVLSLYIDCSQTVAPATPAPSSSSAASSGTTNATTTTAPPTQAATTSPPTGTAGHNGAGRVVPGATFILAVLGLAYMA